MLQNSDLRIQFSSVQVLSYERHLIHLGKSLSKHFRIFGILWLQKLSQNQASSTISGGTWNFPNLPQIFRRFGWKRVIKRAFSRSSLPFTCTIMSTAIIHSHYICIFTGRSLLEESCASESIKNSQAKIANGKTKEKKASWLQQSKVNK